MLSIGSGIQFFNVNIVGSSDGTYFVSSVPTDTTLVLEAPYNIPKRPFRFLPSSNVSVIDDSFFLPDHRMPPGAPIYYSSEGDAEISGLTTDTTYFVIRVNQHNIKLASTSANARAGIPITLNGIPTNGLNHILTTSSIGGEVIAPANVSVTSGSYVVTGTSSRFTNTFKIGDAFKVLQSNVTYSATVSVVLSNSKLEIQTPFGFSNAETQYLLTTGLYVKADALSLHRPFDGGVELIASTNADSQVIRQTRKYFRYQSGKGIQISVAVNFSAPTEILSLTRVGSIATVETRRPHRLKPGVQVRIDGTDDVLWQGLYTVTDTPSTVLFRFVLTTTPQSTSAGGIPIFYVTHWSNSHLRAGFFDDQNGMFYEYDGQTLFCCRRSSVRQIPGTAQMTFNSPIVNGTNTTFTTSLAVKDTIVIKGQTYKVVNIANNELMYIQPVYRGRSQTNVVITKTETTKVPQSEWNIDTCDGSGPTGYNIDVNKIQMAYIDYSWYGAGAIRFGFKVTDGEVRYVHKFVHNNQFTEAYMRSGNMACRYEIENSGIPTFVPSLLHWGTSVIMDGGFNDDKAYLFTASGRVLTYSNGDTKTFTANSNPFSSFNARYNVYNPSTQRNESGYYIYATTYSQVSSLRSGSIISNVTYLASGTKVINIYSYSSGAIVAIDKSPLGAFSNQTITIGEASTGSDIPAVIPLLSIRLAPSADNGRPGFLGDREVINRMQMRLKTIGVLTTNDTEIRLYLNASIDNRSWDRATVPSLSQLVIHNKGDAIEGGTQIFNFRASGGAKDSTGIRNASSTDFELNDLVDLGNSISGGNGIFPNGPDLLTIAAAVIDTTGITANNPYNITSRITWSESQA